MIRSDSSEPLSANFASAYMTDEPGCQSGQPGGLPCYPVWRCMHATPATPGKGRRQPTGRLGAIGLFWMPVPTCAAPRTHAISRLSYESSPECNGLDLPVPAFQYGSKSNDATSGFALAAACMLARTPYDAPGRAASSQPVARPLVPQATWSNMRLPRRDFHTLTTQLPRHTASRVVYWRMNIKRFREARAKRSNQTAGVMLLVINQGAQTPVRQGFAGLD